MRGIARTTLAAAVALGAATVGLAGTAAAATPAMATQHVTAGSQWALIDKYTCGTITFAATTFTDSFGDSGTWSGGRNWIAIHFTSGDGTPYKNLGTYSDKEGVGVYLGHFAAPSGEKPKSAMVPGTCPST